MSEQIDYVMVRRDSKNLIEMIKKSDFDSTGYSLLETHPNHEEWVEADRLKNYQKLRKRHPAPKLNWEFKDDSSV